MMDKQKARPSGDKTNAKNLYLTKLVPNYQR
jgi:hypothetical protein